MKKILYLIITLLTFTVLSACDPVDDYIVDCEKFPTHETCMEDTEPLDCEDGYIEQDEECVPVTSDDDVLDIYFLNDFHGALDESSDQIGITYIANFIKTKKAENPDNVLFLAGGDMLQGSPISNYYLGLSTINMLSEMGLDAFTIGNHEFDWGLDVIQSYKDGNDENGEADFPFLGANIFIKGTTTIPDNIDPYTIIEKGTHKIGIIGTIGYGLEDSIATSKVADYEFADPVPIIQSYASYLRTEEACDIIIVLAHDSGDINTDLSNLSGDERIDAVFNGHSHNDYKYIINNTSIMQSGSSGEFVGHLRFVFQDGTLPTMEQTLYSKYMDALFFDEDIAVLTLLEQYKAETDDIFNNEIIVSDDHYSSYELSIWLTELIRKLTGADIAFHNFGGTRTDVDDGESITLGKLYEIWPFDNTIKTVELTGVEVAALMASSQLMYTSSIDEVDLNATYLVATNDYVFDKDTNPFIYGTNPTYTGLVLRDVVETELELQAELYPTFSIDNDLLSNPTITTYFPQILYIKKED